MLKFEKEALGFYVTGHPLDEFRETMDLMSTTNTEMIPGKSDGQIVRFGGSLKAVKTIWTKKNDQMAFIELEDYTGTLEVVVFPSVFLDLQGSVDRGLAGDGGGQSAIQ